MIEKHYLSAPLFLTDDKTAPDSHLIGWLVVVGTSGAGTGLQPSKHALAASDSLNVNAAFD